MRKLGDMVPAGYSETIDCMNQTKSWNVSGMIADMAENLRVGNEVPAGQLLAALDWMSFRLGECRGLLCSADSELSAIAHNRPADVSFCQKISDDARSLRRTIAGFEVGAKERSRSHD